VFSSNISCRYFNVSSPCDSLQCSIILCKELSFDKESKRKKLNTPVKENFCKNLFQTPKSNQNEGNDFKNDEIQMEVCCPSEKEIPECDSESIEINDMIELLPKVLKSLEDVGQKESFLKFMGQIASGTFPLHNICYLLFLDIVE
jgi:hypothetical protein